MAPMMQPLPRPVGHKRFRSEELGEPKGRRPQPVGQLVLAGGLCLASAGMVLWAVLMAGAGVKPAGQPAAVAEAELTENHDGWHEDAAAGALGAKAQELVLRHPGMKPGHREVKTSLVRINLRTLDRAAEPPANGSGKSKAPEPESGGVSGGLPEQARAPEGERPPPVGPGPDME